MKNIKVIHGPNLNMLGQREESIYGTTTLDEINKEIKRLASKYGINTSFYQSNIEGSIIEQIQQSAGKVDIIIINPAAYTHYSIAIRDALLAVNIPFIEVHLSNIYKRESFRKVSMLSDIAIGQVSGFGEKSYYLAVDAAVAYLSTNLT